MSLPPPLHASMALFLDFDGTLAPIQDDPDSVALPIGGADKLERCSRYLEGAVAIISGRGLSDLAVRVPATLWRLGGHGMEVAAPGEALPEPQNTAPETLVIRLQDIVGDLPGVRLEPKGQVIAVHYRAAPQAGAQLSEAIETVLLDYPDYRLQSGKMVLEAKPSAADKGRALAKTMQQSPFAGRIPVMIGDDTTDEAAMSAARSAGGFAIKVGVGPTVAQYRLKHPEEVWAWLSQPST